MWFSSLPRTKKIKAYNSISVGFNWSLFFSFEYIIKLETIELWKFNWINAEVNCMSLLQAFFLQIWVFFVFIFCVLVLDNRTFSDVWTLLEFWCLKNIDFFVLIRFSLLIFIGNFIHRLYERYHHPHFL